MARKRPLIAAVETYLAVRRAAGFDLRHRGRLLVSFARFADARGDRLVRGTTVEAWAALGSSPAQRERRLQIVVPFAKYARGEDSRHEIPRRHVFSHTERQRPIPFLYTEQQVGRILEEARRLPPRGSLRSRTYETLFGLLAATGLRVSEALALDVGDVTSDGLVIRRTKFRKSRLVPLHPSVASVLNDYVRRRGGSAIGRIFVDGGGNGLRYWQVLYAFGAVLRAAGIGRRPGGPRPLIHSFRHTYAVRAFETCPHDPTRIARHMVALATYLGHVHISSTYWYLQATPKIMADIAEACETFAQEKSR
jgi:integrase